ncbi:hypothetical protein ES703_120413 [subsurface metagenome]
MLSGVTTDLDGNARFVDDPGTTDTGNGTAPIVDMGVYEYWPAIFVDADAIGANDGTNWANAYNYLKDALAVAQDGDEIWVAEGIYKPDQGGGIVPGNRYATFQLKNGVTIKGGYTGYGEEVPNQRNVGLYKTILSGDLDGNDVENIDPCDLLGHPSRAENSYQVVTGSATDGTAVLEGFTITGGNADGSYPRDIGGGMYNYAGSPTLTNCTFSGNSALNYGGAMYNTGYSSPMLTNCTFRDNAVTDSGGGMFNDEHSSPTVTNCTFTGNSAGNYGGGMHNSESSSPTLTNCILWADSAPNEPEIYNSLSTPTVTYSDIEGCGGSGGGWDPNCGADGGGNIDDDPLFIGPNGPDAIPGTADDGDANVHNVHLLGRSPCINSGDPSGDYSGQVDIDGQTRVAYSRVDMGADEVFPIAGDFEPDGDVDFADFAIFAGHWLAGVE